MKKTLKWIMIGISLLLVAGIIFVVVSSYIDHRKLIKQEKKAYPAPGVLVDVNDNGNKLHVYTEGEGSETLVFMSGLGTSSPVYDFKALYSQLSDDYRIAVVERAGYGWSDITSNSRKIDTVLEETRTALQQAGESPPYVLFPHSIAGLEAIYWANLYPEEIKTIIGLETLVPAYYEQTKENVSLSRIITFLAHSGLMRSQPDVFRNNFPAMKKGQLTEKEAKIARTIFFRRVNTKNMRGEADLLPTNSQLVFKQGKPNLPYHAFISDEKEKTWKETLTSYTTATGGKSFLLDAGHYIHLDQPKFIAEKSKELIEKTISN